MFFFVSPCPFEVNRTPQQNLELVWLNFCLGSTNGLEPAVGIHIYMHISIYIYQAKEFLRVPKLEREHPGGAVLVAGGLS